MTWPLRCQARIGIRFASDDAVADHGRVRLRSVAMIWAALCCVLASGCASRAQSSAGFTPRFGQSAVVVAHHIPGCTGVRAGPPPYTHSTTDPDTVAGTAATCVIDEHLVAITVWRNAPAHGAAISMIQFGPTAVASGKSWMAQIPDQQAGLAVQRRIAARIATALNGKVYTYPSR